MQKRQYPHRGLHRALFAGFIFLISGAGLSAEAVSGLDKSRAASESLPSCMHKLEQEAHALRFLQSQLMVASLYCESRVPVGGPTPIRDIYNRLVTEKAAEFKRGSPILQNYLSRKGKKGLEHYLTALANDFSLHFVGVARFCPMMQSRLASLQPLISDAAGLSVDSDKRISPSPIDREEIDSVALLDQMLLSYEAPEPLCTMLVPAFAGREGDTAPVKVDD